MATANPTPAGTVLRNSDANGIIFVVESAYIFAGGEYLTGDFIVEQTNTVIAHVNRCVLSEEWCWYDSDDDDDYSRRVDDYSDDAEALASIGWGTDEDYGYFGGGDDF